jgi:hypothetical protein
MTTTNSTTSVLMKIQKAWDIVHQVRDGGILQRLNVDVLTAGAELKDPIIKTGN